MTPSNPAETRGQLLQLLKESGAVRFGRFTLASGQVSDVYVDIKKAWTDPRRLSVMAEALSQRVGDAERLAGMELGAVPLVVATALRTGLPYAVVRKAAKDHGTQQRYEGEIPPGSRVLVIEDVSTTGGSSEETVAIVRAAGGIVDRILVVVDRNQGARERLAARGVTLEPLVSLDELRGAPP
ncbi:MAG: orotate phosphoribosyltransferase [Thermoplasmata archaeon]|nr:orotate phosphoribosyltransferase [Thermoplasmata archaeon]